MLFELEDLEETKDRLLLNELRRDKDGDGKYISDMTWTLDFVQSWRNVVSNPWTKYKIKMTDRLYTIIN